MGRDGPSRRTLLQGAGCAAPLLATGPALAHPTATTPWTTSDLKVEWRTAPLGIDTPRPRFSWTLAAQDPAGRGLKQTHAEVVVSRTRAAAARGRGEVWGSGKLAADRPGLTPAADLTLASQAEYWWAARTWNAEGRASGWSEPARFVTGLMDPPAWAGARWIAAEPDRPAHIARMFDAPTLDKGAELPIFRRDFQADRPVRQAVVSISGLGQYELRLNGTDVTASILNPGWTDYRKTVLYETYDVTHMLRPGANTLGVLLGNGMYNVEGVRDRYTKLVGSFGQPKLILVLRLLHEDGSETRVVSDGSWATHPGPITFSHIYGGEDLDARLEPRGWDRPGHPAEGWSPALLVDGPGGKLRAQGEPPVITADALEPVAVTEPRPGVFVYDFGRNFAGLPSIVVQGPAGAMVKLTPGELLGPDGLVSQRSGGARPDRPVLFRYTLAGAGEEHWRPRFSYYGFRYLQVEGAAPPGRGPAGTPILLRLRGQEIHADLARVGVFQSSDALLTRIHHLIDAAVTSNMVSVLTDCPTREKLGWLEQTHLNAATVLYNRDAITLYEKLSGDITDAQLPSGEVPEIAPEDVQFVNRDGSDSIFRDSPEWGAAVVLALWAAYRFYGDERVLAEGYPAMRRYVDYLATRARDGLLSYGLGDWYDIGPKPPGVAQLTSLGVTGTAIWYEMLTALARIATVIGRPQDEAADFARRAAEVRRAFNAALFHPGSDSYDRDSQTANAMPLALGMVPEGRETAVLARLVADISAHGWRVTAGDVGFHYVVQALMAHGRDDVLLRMMSLTDGASYGGQLARGATTLTEAWDASPDHSQDHFMLGHGEAWLYGGLGGIRIDFAAAGGPAITVAPRPVGDVASARASYRSAWGEVVSDWRREGERLHLDATIPTGTEGRIVLPTHDLASILEGGAPLARARGVRKVAADPRGVALIVGSGRYRLEARL